MVIIMIYVILTVVLFLTDQLTKLITVRSLALYESAGVIDGILAFTRYHNTGGPWSLFDDFHALFIIATFAIFIAEFVYLRKHPLQGQTAKTACSLINAGALGNLVDRIFRGYVVDMIDVRFIDYPIFNFADCCIVIGCVLMCVYVLFIYKESDDKKENDNGKANTDM